MKSNCRTHGILLSGWIVLFLVSLFCGFVAAQGPIEAPGIENPAAQALLKKLRKAEGAYISEKYRYALVPPKGYQALSEEQTRQIVMDGRKKDKIPDLVEGGLEGAPIFTTIFQPAAYDISGRRMTVTPNYPLWQTIEEFEKYITPDTGDFFYYSRETLNIRNQKCYLLDREFDVMGTRVRQLCAYFPDMTLPTGYFLVFAALSVDFDEYKESFLTSLKTFKIIPPDLPKGAKENLYRGPPKRRAEAWRSLPVIGSLVAVFVFAIWFLVKRLSAGAGEEDESILAEDVDDPEEENPSDKP